MADTSTYINTLLTSTEAHRKRKIIDHVFDSNPIIRKIYRQRKHAPGGTYIIVPIQLVANDTVGGRAELEPYDLTLQEPLKGSQWPWREVSGETTISSWTQMKNSGKEALINYMQVLIDNLTRQCMDELETHLFGTANSDDDTSVLDFCGLQHMVPTDPTTDIVGGIDRALAANDNWESQTVNVGDFSSTWNNRLINAINSSTWDGMSPDMIVLTQTYWEQYQEIMTAKQQGELETKDPAYAGYQTLFFASRPVWWSRKVPANTGYVLNSKGINIYTHKAADFRRMPVEKVNLQDAWFVRIKAFGNIVLESSRTQCCLHTMS